MRKRNFALSKAWPMKGQPIELSARHGLSPFTCLVDPRSPIEIVQYPPAISIHLGTVRSIVTDRSHRFARSRGAGANGGSLREREARPPSPKGDSDINTSILHADTTAIPSEVGMNQHEIWGRRML